MFRWWGWVNLFYRGALYEGNTKELWKILKKSRTGEKIGTIRWRCCNLTVSKVPIWRDVRQGCIFRLKCSHPEVTEDHVLTSAYVKIFRTAARNAINKSVWRKKDSFWLPLLKHAINIWLSSLRIRAHLSWRTGKHLHVLHVLRNYSTCSYPGY